MFIIISFPPRGGEYPSGVEHPCKTKSLVARGCFILHDGLLPVYLCFPTFLHRYFLYHFSGDISVHIEQGFTFLFLFSDIFLISFIFKIIKGLFSTIAVFAGWSANLLQTVENYCPQKALF